MNKRLLLALVLLGAVANVQASSCDSCDCKATSQTFFSVRPQFQGSSPERVSLWRGRMDDRVDGYNGALQATIFGGKSSQDDRFAQYFFPNCQKCLVVAEQEATEGIDVLAQHLNINTTDGDFHSKVTIDPQQSVVGFGLNYVKGFRQDDEGRGYWLSVSLPIVRVRNEMNLCENVIDDGNGVLEGNALATAAGVVGNATDAFKQSGWKYGRINDNCDTTETKLADVEVRLGKEWVKDEMCHLESSIGFIAPAGNRPEAKKVFEPIVGHNDHWGLVFGNSDGFEIWHHDTKDMNLRMEFDLTNMYLFESTERRSFDLKNKPWSRYMLLFANEEAAQAANTANDSFAHTPGINVFTRDLKIKPRFNHTLNTAFVLNYNSFQGELGYNYYCRQAECVKLDCAWVEGPALRRIASQNGVTNRYQFINDLVENEDDLIGDYSDNIIKAADLDLESAAAPGITSHTIYGALGYNSSDREYPMFFGLGGSYEWSDDNTGLDRWLVWAKAGVSF